MWQKGTGSNMWSDVGNIANMRMVSLSTKPTPTGKFCNFLLVFSVFLILRGASWLLGQRCHVSRLTRKLKRREGYPGVSLFRRSPPKTRTVIRRSTDQTVTFCLAARTAGHTSTLTASSTNGHGTALFVGLSMASPLSALLATLTPSLVLR